MAPVPESVSRSIGTSAAASSNKLYPAASRALARSARVVSRIGSTEWIRNGSMIVRNGSSVVTAANGIMPTSAMPAVAPAGSRACITIDLICSGAASARNGPANSSP